MLPPIAWNVITARVGMPERLAARVWRAIERSPLPEAGALRYHVGRVSFTLGSDDYWGAAGTALAACSPQRIVRLLEALAQAGAMPWREANQAMEMFLQHADIGGNWDLWRITTQNGSAA